MGPDGCGKMIDYGPGGIWKPNEPVWLQAQREQANEARVGLSNLAPACDIAAGRHETPAGNVFCQCGMLRVMITAELLTVRIGTVK